MKKEKPNEDASSDSEPLFSESEEAPLRVEPEMYKEFVSHDAL